MPNLGALVTFEVAAKHLSFTSAARELNITQGAVSQQIRQLEDVLGEKLFIRKHNALEITSKGLDLLSSVSGGLDQISAGLSGFNPQEAPRSVTISATDALAALWLKPLIDSFTVNNPEARFTVLASDEDDALSRQAEVDIALLCGNERFDVGDELLLMYPEVAQPVCSPAFLEEFGPFEGPDDFARAKLLHLHERHWSSGAVRWHPLGWAEWFAAQGKTWDRSSAVFSTNKVTLLTEAGVQGQGVMMGIHNLVAAHIEAGTLVFAHSYKISSGRSNFMKINPASKQRPMVAAFSEHLLGALRAH